MAQTAGGLWPCQSGAPTQSMRYRIAHCAGTRTRRIERTERVSVASAAPKRRVARRYVTRGGEATRGDVTVRVLLRFSTPWATVSRPMYRGHTLLGYIPTRRRVPTAVGLSTSIYGQLATRVP